jgi:hypothetical protein
MGWSGPLELILNGLQLLLGGRTARMVDDLRRNEKGAVGGELLIGSSIPSVLDIAMKAILLTKLSSS